MERYSKNYSTALIIYIALSFSIIMLAVVAETLAALGVKPFIPDFEAKAGFLRYVFYVAGLGMLFALKFVKAAFLGRKFASEEETVQALSTGTIITAGLNENAALMGFILVLLSGNRMDFYILLAASLVSAALNFPKKSDWEDFLNAARTGAQIPGSEGK